MIRQPASCNPVSGNQEVPTAIPEKGVRLYCFLVYNNLFKLIRLNLLYILFCIPIITIPAASGGMARVLIKLVDTGQCFVFSDFYEEFKRNFARYLSLGLLSITSVLLLYLLASYCIEIKYYLVGAIGLFISAAGIMLLVVMSLYAYVLTASVNLRFFQVIKNGFLLCLVSLRRNVLLVAGLVLMTILTYLLFPFSLLWIILIGLSMTGLAICLIVRSPIKKYITDPFLRAQ